MGDVAKWEGKGDAKTDNFLFLYGEIVEGQPVSSAG